MTTVVMASTREQLKAKPFDPVQSTDVQYRYAHSLEYIAFSLGEIAEELQKLNTNAASLDKTLQAISSKMTHRE